MARSEFEPHTSNSGGGRLSTRQWKWREAERASHQGQGRVESCMSKVRKGERHTALAALGDRRVTRTCKVSRWRGSLIAF